MRNLAWMLLVGVVLAGPRDTRQIGKAGARKGTIAAAALGSFKTTAFLLGGNALYTIDTTGSLFRVDT